MGAGGEGIAVTWVINVMYFRFAFIAQSDIRCDQKVWFPGCCTLDDFEFLKMLDRSFINSNIGNYGYWRSFALKPVNEILQMFQLTFRFDMHAIHSIAHPTMNIQFMREAINKRTETNTLNLAFDMDVETLHVNTSVKTTWRFSQAYH